MFSDFITNNIILAPISAWLLAQILKLIIHSLIERKFRISRIFGDGGMPSGHSATVSALVVMCGWCEGFNSAVFAVSIIVAIIVMHDAMGVRRETGKQAYTIKQLADIVNGMFAEKDKEVRTEKLKEFVGHTPMQVIFGSVLGVVVAIVYINAFGLPYRG